MTAKKRKVFGFSSLAVFIIGVAVAVYCVAVIRDNQVMASGLKLARLSVSLDALERIQREHEAGRDVMATADYAQLVRELKSVTAAFPGFAQWTYIASPTADEAKGRLTVLTIDPTAEPETQAGYIYDLADYPAMHRALYTDADIVISGVLWDSTYKIITRSGFAKLHSPGGGYLGVLCVDMKTGHLLYIFFIALLFTALIIVISFLLGLQLAQATGLIARG